MRFDAEIIAALPQIACCDWLIDKILAHERAITGTNLAVLRTAQSSGP